MKVGPGAFDVNNFVSELVMFMGSKHELGYNIQEDNFGVDSGEKDLESIFDWDIDRIGRKALAKSCRVPTEGFMLGPLPIEANKQLRSVSGKHISLVILDSDGKVALDVQSDRESAIYFCAQPSDQDYENGLRKHQIILELDEATWIAKRVSALRRHGGVFEHANLDIISIMLCLIAAWEETTTLMLHEGSVHIKFPFATEGRMESATFSSFWIQEQFMWINFRYQFSLATRNAFNTKTSQGVALLRCIFGRIGA
ncbi:hypothetical protein ARMGADRAFT_1037753 [Armillaria gallica]|uniref:Uncharacterized protein n=1 Tax=Armillaria gallica TaxID=47427 RepID=A0A2H3CKG7_ARMGA|nr:hypothetical protein ARMGADRAFT_1037753 [Armillaria gallica]